MNHIDYEKDNPDYSQRAQREYLDFLDSWWFLEPAYSGRNNKKSLRELLISWEWKIVIPRRRINTVNDALARFGI